MAKVIQRYSVSTQRNLEKYKNLHQLNIGDQIFLTEDKKLLSVYKKHR